MYKVCDTRAVRARVTLTRMNIEWIFLKTFSKETRIDIWRNAGSIIRSSKRQNPHKVSEQVEQVKLFSQVKTPVTKYGLLCSEEENKTKKKTL